MGLLLGLAGSFIKKIDKEEEVKENPRTPFDDMITLSDRHGISGQPLISSERLSYSDQQRPQ
jgi:hypothetical protein